MKPKITVLLCTVRPAQGYVNHPEWDIIDKVLGCLQAQTFKDFELIIVDGLWQDRRLTVDLEPWTFPVRHVSPRASLWTQHKKIAICAYRNTGLSYARGELVVNLDDCCVLPENYLELFWRAWSEYHVCASATWPRQGDHRAPGRMQYPGQVYGFGSYPLAAALELNGYDEAYDGAQGLEDGDWSTRLFHLGVEMALLNIPGFDIEAQSGHSPEAIDIKRPIVKCCNAAWQTQRVWRQVREANRKELWSTEALERLIGPCRYLNTDQTCAHHQGRLQCAYLDRGFARERDPLAARIFEYPPVFDLLETRRAYGID